MLQSSLHRSFLIFPLRRVLRYRTMSQAQETITPARSDPPSGAATPSSSEPTANTKSAGVCTQSFCNDETFDNITTIQPKRRLSGWRKRPSSLRKRPKLCPLRLRARKGPRKRPSGKKWPHLLTRRRRARKRVSLFAQYMRSQIWCKVSNIVFIVFVKHATALECHGPDPHHAPC
jgi:hypothetical protein